jgi:hypothetical protein
MNQRGQLVIESVLILSLLVALGAVVAVGFKNNDLFSNMVSAPWKSLSGLLQNGVWSPPERSMAQHPANHGRHISIRGDTPK